MIDDPRREMDQLWWAMSETKALVALSVPDNGSFNFERSNVTIW